MKTINLQTLNKVVWSMSLLIILSACSDRKDPLGKWDDCIKLSLKEVNFEAPADSVVITTQGDWWWIDGVSVNDKTYSFYDAEDVDLESDSYSIQEDCFTVERRDKNTLFVKIDDNNTSLERIITITLEAGDYFDHITIRQAAD